MPVQNGDDCGFTLVELIISISILAVLASLSVVAINPPSVLARARDSKRIADLGVLVSAITSYDVDNGIYPDDSGVIRYSNSLPQGQSGPLQSSDNGWIKGPFSKYVSSLLTDPTNSGLYVYRYKRSANTFEVDARFEYYKEKAVDDGGNDNATFEAGNDLSLLD